MMYGAMNPSGSNKEYTTDTMPRLVTGFLEDALISLSETSHTNLSSSMSHFIPKALWVGSCSSSKFTTVLALSDSGIAAMTLLSLLHHFVR